MVINTCCVIFRLGRLRPSMGQKVNIQIEEPHENFGAFAVLPRHLLHFLATTFPQKEQLTLRNVSTQFCHLLKFSLIPYCQIQKLEQEVVGHYFFPHPPKYFLSVNDDFTFNMYMAELGINQRTFCHSSIFLKAQ